MLRGEMVRIVSHPLGLQDSGQLWEWSPHARKSRLIEGERPPTWSDRRRPNRAYILCSRHEVNPGPGYGRAVDDQGAVPGLRNGQYMPRSSTVGPPAVRGWI